MTNRTWHRGVIGAFGFSALAAWSGAGAAMGALNPNGAVSSETRPEGGPAKKSVVDELIVGRKWEGMSNDRKVTIEVTKRSDEKQTASLKVDPQGGVYFILDLSTANSKITVIRAERHLKQRVDPDPGAKIGVSFEKDGAIRIKGEAHFDIGPKKKNKVVDFNYFGKPVTEDPEAKGRKKKGAQP